MTHDSHLACYANGPAPASFRLGTRSSGKSREVQNRVRSAHRHHVLVEAEEIGWIVFGLEFNQSCVIASECCPYRLWLLIAEEIQQVAVACIRF
jgi:hypothetical protein